MNKPMTRRKPKRKPSPLRRAKSITKTIRADEEENSAFRVLIAVHRPRYRGRAERAVAFPDWRLKSLLNKEDPVGMVNQKPPHLLILSDDFGRQKDLAIFRAIQKYRGQEMRVIGLFQDADGMIANAHLCDAALTPPWKTADLRTLVAQQYAEVTGKTLEVSVGSEDED